MYSLMTYTEILDETRNNVRYKKTYRRTSWPIDQYIKIKRNGPNIHIYKCCVNDRLEIVFHPTIEDMTTKDWHHVVPSILKKRWVPIP